MSPSIVSSSAFLALLLACTFHSSRAIPDQQLQQICICTNYTEPCNAFLASQDEFKSAHDPKALAPLVIKVLGETMNETSNYVHLLAKDETIKDEKLKKLYDGCAKLYDFAGAEVYSALENAKSASEAIVKELLEESRIFVDDCVAGPKELNVTDSSHLPRGNEMVKALLNISIVKFAS